jgi:alpha-1,2-mannosyltransferase
MRAKRLLSFAYVLFCIALNAAQLALYGQPGDLPAFAVAASLLRAGANPYAADAPGLPGFGIVPLGLYGTSPNLNPPCSLFAFAPLADADVFTLAPYWKAASVALYAVALFLLWRAYRPSRGAVAWAFALAGFWATLDNCQIYVPLLLLVVGAWLLLRTGREVPAGLLLGLLAAVKPNFAVVPALLLLAGHWRVSLAALASFAAPWLAALLAYGPEMYARWWEATGAYQGVLFPGNASLIGLFSRLRWPQAGYALSAALLLALAVWAWRLRPSLLHVAAVSLCASLLASPIAWISYTVLLLPVLAHLHPSRGALLVGVALSVPSALLGFPLAISGTWTALAIWGSWYLAPLLGLCALTLWGWPASVHVSAPSYPPLSPSYARPRTLP